MEALWGKILEVVGQPFRAAVLVLITLGLLVGAYWAVSAHEEAAVAQQITEQTAPWRENHEQRIKDLEVWKEQDTQARQAEAQALSDISGDMKAVRQELHDYLESHHGAP